MAQVTSDLRPAIYPDVPFSDYCNGSDWGGILNQSSVSRAYVGEHFSLKKLKAILDGRVKFEKTKDTEFGRAGHARLLEPATFEERFSIASPCQAMQKKTGQPCGVRGKYFWDGVWYCGVRGHCPVPLEQAEAPEDYISPEQFDRLEAAVAEIQKNPVVQMLRAQGGFEESFVSELCGVKVKGRVDKDISEPIGTFPPTVVDIKYVRPDYHEAELFFRKVREYRYHLQMAWYCDALKAVDGIDRMGLWVVIEKAEPYDISVFPAKQSLLIEGRRLYSSALSKYKAAVESDCWPGLYSDIKNDWVPEWYLRQQAGVV